jgi:cellulose synthase/poly-beta-1,6-N-acetylglucosamine synthase-like glycosyltransferase
MNVPSVSVIIPSYNTATFIAETLDSVFAQTFTDFEVILIAGAVAVCILSLLIYARRLRVRHSLG